MKKFTQVAIVFLLMVGNTFGQQEKGIIGTSNWLNNWAEFKPNKKDYGEPTQILSGDIKEDTRLSKRYVYLLMGNVFVVNNATLTIEPGTVIIGDFDSKASLTISKGAKIIADGLETDPIVFTSSRTVKRAGDWGGLIILGDAPTNKFGSGSVALHYYKPASYVYENASFGGENASDSSGTLKYVRIEYAGKRIKDKGYFNGLLLAGIGNETVLENIMVSYSAGNSFEILGGEVNLNKAVSYRSYSNDFEFNFGTQCTMNNSLVVRSPYTSNSNGAKCMNIKSYDNEEEVDFAKKGTAVIANNLTLLNHSDDLKSAIDMGLVHEAVYVRKNASLNMRKSVISGFNPAVVFENNIRVDQESLEKIKFTNMFFNNCNGNIFVDNKPNNEDLENWYGNSAFFNVYSKTPEFETFIDLNSTRRPDFRLRINKIVASNSSNEDD